MNRYWPAGLELNDTQSPMEILEAAKADWEAGSDGRLTLVLQKTISQNNNEMIIVHAKHISTNRTSSLFSVVHRPGSPYPVTIQPRDSDIPNFLRKEYYQAGTPSFSALSGSLSVTRALEGTPGRTIQNRWVSEKPSEFRLKLEEAFNLGVVTTEILNLVSHTAPAVDETTDYAGETTDSESDTIDNQPDAAG